MSDAHIRLSHQSPLCVYTTPSCSINTQMQEKSDKGPSPHLDGSRGVAKQVDAATFLPVAVVYTNRLCFSLSPRFLCLSWLMRWKISLGLTREAFRVSRMQSTFLGAKKSLQIGQCTGRETQKSTQKAIDDGCGRLAAAAAAGQPN